MLRWSFKQFSVAPYGPALHARDRDSINQHAAVEARDRPLNPHPSLRLYS
jgi:hypothetical protein